VYTIATVYLALVGVLGIGLNLFVIVLFSRASQVNF
jgi:hypothetical protein